MADLSAKQSALHTFTTGQQHGPDRSDPFSDLKNEARPTCLTSPRQLSKTDQTGLRYVTNRSDGPARNFWVSP